MKFLYATATVMTVTLVSLLVPVHAIAPPSSVQTPIVAATTTTTTTTSTTTTTVAEPAIVGVPTDLTMRCQMFEPMLREYGLRPVQMFSYIAWRESRCRVQAINAKWNSAGQMIWSLNKDGSYDSGLLQINSSWKTVTRDICGGDLSLLVTLDCNLRVAKYLLDNGGLGHWSASLP